MSWAGLILLVALFVILTAGGGGHHTRMTGPPDVPWEDEDTTE